MPGKCLCDWIINFWLDMLFGKPDDFDYESTTIPNPRPECLT